MGHSGTGPRRGFAEAHEVPGIELVTIALRDEDQIDSLGLIKAEMPKKKHERYPWWPHDWTVELEAVSPDDLAAIITGSIQGMTDADTGRRAGRAYEAA